MLVSKECLGICLTSDVTSVHRFRLDGLPSQQTNDLESKSNSPDPDHKAEDIHHLEDTESAKSSGGPQSSVAVYQDEKFEWGEVIRGVFRILAHRTGLALIYIRYL